MRFALTGSHGVGKTSVINGLEDYLLDTGITCITNASKARNIRHSGIKINDEATEKTEMIIACNHISNFSNDNWFSDRSIIDTYAYCSHNFINKRIPDDTYKAIVHLTDKFISAYDALFYIPIEFPMVDDGIRKIDNDYRMFIDLIIRDKLKEMCRYKEIRGTVEERIELIKQSGYIPL